MKKSFGQKALILIGCFLLAALLGNVLLMGLLLSQGADMSSIGSLSDMFSQLTNTSIIKLGIGINHLLTFVGTAYLYHYFIKENRFQRYFKLIEPIDWKLMGLFLLLLFVSYPIIGASGMILQSLDLPEWMSSMDSDYTNLMEGLFSDEGIFAIILNVIIIALLPAVGEELIFRGIVQKELHRVIANPHLAIVLTSILFSAIHMQAVGFLPKLVISLILCYAYYWTQNLWYPIIIHFVNNAFLTLSVFFTKDQLAQLDSTHTESFSWWGILFSIVACGFTVTYIIQYIRSNTTQTIAADEY